MNIFTDQRRPRRTDEFCLHSDCWHLPVCVSTVPMPCSPRVPRNETVPSRSTKNARPLFAMRRSLIGERTRGELGKPNSTYSTKFHLKNFLPKPGSSRGDEAHISSVPSALSCSNPDPATRPAVPSRSVQQCTSKRIIFQTTSQKNVASVLISTLYGHPKELLTLPQRKSLISRFFTSKCLNPRTDFKPFGQHLRP
jgi:hypothetical protein